MAGREGEVHMGLPGDWGVRDPKGQLFCPPVGSLGQVFPLPNLGWSCRAYQESLGVPPWEREL